ncbi:MAG TPA: Gfo/Idh/MocA family oxidoreductase [Chthonomonadales bacterium]|nr:Gfo/Idh/MocA family oxidoreductase [Chthonomonadales bacterium]
MSEILKVALIGAGGMANSVHYPSLASFPDVSLEAICDLDETRLRETADRFHIARTFRNYEEMLDAVDADAVYAIGQPHLMYDVWLGCLGRGCNLFIEKPPGITLHQTRALAYLAEKNGSLTQVGFQRRCCPLLVNLRDECLKRGPIVHAVCQFYKCQPEPFLGARDHMMDDGVHAIDTLRWICGGEIISIQSVTRAVNTPDTNFLTAAIQFNNGATAILMNSWTSGRRVFRVEMHSHEICAEADPETVGHLYADGDVAGVEFDTRTVARSDDLHVFGGFQAKSREFIDCIHEGRLPGSNLADAVKTMEAAETILAQGLLGNR